VNRRVRAAAGYRVDELLQIRAIHGMSLRANDISIKVNCAAIASGPLESELFGHEKGAFTVVTEHKIGRLELTDEARCFWMKRERFHWPCNPNCSGCRKPRSSNGWGARSHHATVCTQSSPSGHGCRGGRESALKRHPSINELRHLSSAALIRSFWFFGRLRRRGAASLRGCGLVLP